MNIQTIRNYVNLDVDDTYTLVEITQWFNKGIAQYNLIPPLTTYPMVELSGLSTDVDDPATAGVNEAAVAALWYADEDYPLGNNFMLGIMLPYINAAVKSQEASLQEKQLAYQDFLQNARMWKASTNIPVEYMLNKQNTDLEIFQVGENVFISDMRRSPFSENWSAATVFNEIKTTEE